MKDIKITLIALITVATNDMVATSKMPQYNDDGVLKPEFYDETNRQRMDLNSKIEVLAKAIGAFDFIYYVHNNSIEFTFKFDGFTRRELVPISNLETYISRF